MYVYTSPMQPWHLHSYLLFKNKLVIICASVFHGIRAAEECKVSDLLSQPARLPPVSRRRDWCCPRKRWVWGAGGLPLPLKLASFILAGSPVRIYLPHLQSPIFRLHEWCLISDPILFSFIALKYSTTHLTPICSLLLTWLFIIPQSYWHRVNVAQ